MFFRSSNLKCKFYSYKIIKEHFNDEDALIFMHGLFCLTFLFSWFFQVSPDLYGDNNTRLFTYWTVSFLLIHLFFKYYLLHHNSLPWPVVETQLLKRGCNWNSYHPSLLKFEFRSGVFNLFIPPRAGLVWILVVRSWSILKIWVKFGLLQDPV